MMAIDLRPGALNIVDREAINKAVGDLAYFRRLEAEAEKFKVRLIALRTILDGPQMRGGEATDVVTVQMTKIQAAALMVLVEDALK